MVRDWWPRVTGRKLAAVRPFFVSILLGIAAIEARAQQAPDTTLTVEGFLQNDEQVDLWTIVTPLPVQVLGVRTYVLQVVGKADRWSRFRNQYVGARGRVASLPSGGSPGIGIEVETMEARIPRRTARLSVDRGVTFHADVTLSVIPDRFAWRDAQGASTGVNPMLLYTITNHREAPIFFVLPTSAFVCVSLTDSTGGVHWDSTTHVVSPDARRFAVQRGGMLREAINFPEAAAGRRGHYLAHVRICDIGGYDLAAEFDVE
jgi:hypothetical protein